MYIMIINIYQLYLLLLFATCYINNNEPLIFDNTYIQCYYSHINVEDLLMVNTFENIFIECIAYKQLSVHHLGELCLVY